MCESHLIKNNKICLLSDCSGSLLREKNIKIMSLTDWTALSKNIKILR